MTERHFSKGDTLFAKGEVADDMFCAVTGRYVLTELGIEIEPGQVVGELALLAPDNRRTATLECVEDGKVLSITYEQVEQLYYQNPTFGFYFLRLATARLFDNIGRLEAELRGSAPRRRESTRRRNDCGFHTTLLEPLVGQRLRNFESAARMGLTTGVGTVHLRFCGPPCRSSKFHAWNWCAICSRRRCSGCSC